MIVKVYVSVAQNVVGDLADIYSKGLESVVNDFADLLVYIEAVSVAVSIIYDGDRDDVLAFFERLCFDSHAFLTSVALS